MFGNSERENILCVIFKKKSRLEKLFVTTWQNVCEETSKAIMTMVKSHLARTISKSLVMIVVLTLLLTHKAMCMKRINAMTGSQPVVNKSLTAISDCNVTSLWSSSTLELLGIVPVWGHGTSLDCISLKYSERRNERFFWSIYAYAIGLLYITVSSKLT